MKARQRFTGAFIVGLLLIAGAIQVQGQDPEVRRPGSTEELAAVVSGRIPLQGRLTDADGKPLDGTYTIRFRLYDASTDGTVLCEDINSVLVEKGLFTTDIFGCSSSDTDGKALYLGVKVGTDLEMTPRQPIYPAPYAMSLRPGAQIKATLASNAILHIENDGSGGRALRAYAMAESGTNYGVVGASRSDEGYGGYFYNNNTEGGTGLWVQSTAGHAIIGEGGADVNDAGGWFEGDVGAYGTGVNGIYGESITGAGVVGHSVGHYGVFGYTDRSDHNYGLYTTDNCYAANYQTTGAMMQIVQNGGQEPLEPGDVAVFSGMGTPLETGGPPMIQVTKAAAASSTAVAGVVLSRYNIAATTGEPEQLARSGEQVTLEGPVPPGGYLLLVVQGPARVKASAISGAIHPGDIVSSSSMTGHAARPTPLGAEGTSAVLPGTILGKALEPLDSGDRLIYIYVTLD